MAGQRQRSSAVGSSLPFSLQLQRLSAEALKAIRVAASTLQEAGFEDVNVPDLLEAVIVLLGRKPGRGEEEAPTVPVRPALTTQQDRPSVRQRKVEEQDGSSWKSNSKAFVKSLLAKAGPRPIGLAESHKVTQEMRDRQKHEPNKWSVTLGQWLDILAHCVDTDLYKDLKKSKSTVSMYDINELFVKPWTQGTGCGVSILMNPDAGLDAELMFSHAWGEDVEESKAAVEKAMAKEGSRLDRNVVVWFCLFANYQCEDGHGPFIRDQLQLDPFAQVITSQGVRQGHGMCAIHTTKADLYTRLWCVHEVAEAESKDLDVFSAMSPEYTEKITRRMKFFVEHGYDDEHALLGAGITCKTIAAECSFASDEGRLLEKISQTVGGSKRRRRTQRK